MAALALGVSPCAAQSITYQGRLTDNGAPANGNYDLRFQLFTSAAGTTPVGSSICVDDVTVTDGLVTVPLSFPSSSFTGSSRFLKIEVRPDPDSAVTCATTSGFTELSPLRSLASAPQAVNSDKVDNRHASDFMLIGSYDSNQDGIIDPGNTLTNFLQAEDGDPLPALWADVDGEIGIGTTDAKDNLHIQDATGSAGILLEAAPTAAGNQSNTADVAENTLEGGGAVWSSAANALVDDGAVATASFNFSMYTTKLRVRDFDFTIPTNAAIKGIQVTVKRRAGTASSTFDDGAELIGGTTRSIKFVGGAWPTTFQTVTYGSPTDTWGNAWTPAMINSADFGVLLMAHNFVDLGNAQIDVVSVTVFYGAGSFGLAHSNTTGDMVVQQSGTTLFSMTRSGSVSFPSDSVGGIHFENPNMAIKSEDGNIVITNGGGSSGTPAFSFNENGWLGIEMDSPGSTIDIGSGTGGDKYISWETFPSSRLGVDSGDSKFKLLGANNFESDPVFSANHIGDIGLGIPAPADDVHLFRDNADAYLRLDNGTGSYRIGVDATGDSLKILPSANAETAPSLSVDLAGQVGIGVQAAANPLEVAGSVTGGTSPSTHVAWIHNTSTVNTDDVLALSIASTTAPNLNGNMISFYYNNTTAAGSIEGNGVDGVIYATTGADYAEWMKRLDASESLEAGDVVGVFPGGISKRTVGAERVMVVSRKPAVVGAQPQVESDEALGNVVAFIGQVDVRVLGPVTMGDLVIPSGREDGTAIAVSPHAVSSAQIQQLAGIAWETSSFEGEHQVRCVVGTDPGTRAILSQLAEEQNRLKARVDDLEQAVRELQGNAVRLSGK